MAKIVGVRERIGAAGLLARSVQGIGAYEAVGTVEQQYAPYDVRSFGEPKPPYDLNEPGRVAEIKRVLIALGRHSSDPALNPGDPQTEGLFKLIDASDEFADAWDGPTADTFALTVARHKDRFPIGMPEERKSPLVQLPKFTDVHGNDVIIGGPQPTVAGLEAIAQAAHEVLKDSVQLDQYMAWRGGVLNCWEEFGYCLPPDSIVDPTAKMGRPWDPHGWTIAWRNGPAAQANPFLLNELDALDRELEAEWLMAPTTSTEEQRQKSADRITGFRADRDALVRQLNQGAPVPTCKDAATKYDPLTGRCVGRCTPPARWDPVLSQCAITVPPAAYKDREDCMRQQLAPPVSATKEDAEAACDAFFPPQLKGAVIVGLLGALGIGGYVLFRDKAIPKMPVPTT